MKKSATLFLQGVVVLVGIIVFVLMLIEPQLEGRNVNATLFQIYFTDPFLAYVYAGSIGFFVGLYQVFKLLGYVRAGMVFSEVSVKALRTIKLCALITAGAIISADVFLVIHARLYPEVGAVDGPEGAVMLGVVATFISLVVATAATVFQRILQNAVDIKSENDLTV